MKVKEVKIMIIGNQMLKMISINLIKNLKNNQEDLRIVIIIKSKIVSMMILVKWINSIKNFRKNKLTKMNLLSKFNNKIKNKNQKWKSLFKKNL